MNSKKQRAMVDCIVEACGGGSGRKMAAGSHNGVRLREARPLYQKTRNPQLS